VATSAGVSVLRCVWPSSGVFLQALLHRAQVEEQLALGLGGGDLDHAPVLQDVLVDLGRIQCSA
jgi:hypothetical protein